jgi:hypothetical protein
VISRRQFLASLAAIACTSPSRPQPIEAPVATAWDFTRTHVLAFGIVRWRDAESWPPFPSAGRRDDTLIETLVRRGVPRENVVHVQDRAATHARIRREIDRVIARCAPGDSFCFYYAGHGHREDDGASYFVPFDAGDDMAETAVPFVYLIDRLERLRGARALLFADCCYSGALAELSAARRSGPPRATFGASLASELSTGRWTFTDAVIAGLDGAPNADMDGDGTVSLGDLDAFVESQMAFADGQLATCRMSGLPSTFELGDARPKPCARYGERVEARYRNRWWPATIVGEEGGAWRVHYDGFGEEWDEVVGADRMRPYAPLEHPSGALVEVRWRNEWFAARVLEARHGVHRIHYEGFDDTWDEWVARDRIRPLGRVEPPALDHVRGRRRVERDRALRRGAGVDGDERRLQLRHRAARHVGVERQQPHDRRHLRHEHHDRLQRRKHERDRASVGHHARSAHVHVVLRPDAVHARMNIRC